MTPLPLARLIALWCMVVRSSEKYGYIFSYFYFF
jgi:hypothetical protein